MESYHLPVGRIFLEAFDLTRKNFSTLIQYALPVIIVGLAGIGLSVLIDTGETAEPPLVLGMLLLALLFYLCLAMTLVGYHRTFLLGPASVTDTGIFRWSGREWRFVKWQVLLALCAIAIVLAIAFVLQLLVSMIRDEEVVLAPALGFVIYALVSIPVLYVLSRCALVLPAAAIDKNPGLAWAWRFSSQNAWELVILVGLLPLLAGVLRSVFVIDSLLVMLAGGALWLLLGMYEVALLSLSYKYLAEHRGADAPPPEGH